MTFNKKYVEVDKTSSAYRNRVMVEITPEIQELLDLFVKSVKCPEAKAIRLATLIGLRTIKNTIGYDNLTWMSKKERARK